MLSEISETLFTARKCKVICCISSLKKFEVLPGGRLTSPSLPCGLRVVLNLFALTEVHTFSGFEELVQPGIAAILENQASLP